MFQKLNMDFNKSIVINPQEHCWQSSPNASVHRVLLEREKQESGHATSIVKYLPNSKFKEHDHPLGEEILVLDGTFSDENGNYPKGSYIRNPSKTKHSPYSNEGCTLFVKLNQFNENDDEQKIIHTETAQWHQGQGNLKVMPLHQHGAESTALVLWPKGERFVPHTHFGGEEIFVLSGTFKDEHGDYPKHTWMRSKHLSKHHPWVEEETIIFVKTGHLI